MEFSRQNGNPYSTQQPATAGQPAQTTHHSSSEKKKKKMSFNLMNGLAAVLLFSVAVLIVGVIAFLIFGNNSKTTEADLVDSTKYQAVFLAGGQVYFGKVTSMNSGYMTLEDIYYLRVNQNQSGDQAAQASDISLAKLGNELHGPQDRMVITKSETQFWENLKEEGQVTCAIRDYQINTLGNKDVKKSDKCAAPQQTAPQQ